MSGKQNCWEHTKCSREPGGINTAKLGICPASTDTSANGINGGKNGGRICWAIAGTISTQKDQRTPARNLVSCLVCNFFKIVKNEEGDNFHITKRS